MKTLAYVAIIIMTSDFTNFTLGEAGDTGIPRPA